MPVPSAPSVFERHPKKTLAAVWAVFLVLFVAAAEVGLKHFAGLGRPVLFDAHPAYGYRLKPNQETWRFGGAHFKINNLGLRAAADWDGSPEGKVLFLGNSVTYGGNHIANEALFSERAVHDLGVVSGNAGTPNWGVENVHALVVKVGFLPASCYVSTFIEDDFYRNLTVAHNKPWIKYEKPRFALEEVVDFVFYRYFTETRRLNRAEREREHERAVIRAARELKEMDQMLRARGYAHLVFISPTRRQVLGERPRDARVQALLKANHIDATYLLDVPRVRDASREEKRSWFQDDVHLSPQGHAVWGEVMAPAVRAQLASVKH